MIGIVVSEADPASRRIGEAILERGEWSVVTDSTRPESAGGGTVYRSEHFELRTFQDLHLHLVDVAEAFDDPSVVVFVSRHAGETGPLLSTHFPGNVASAEYGGTARSVPPAAPETLGLVFDRLTRFAPERYDVGIECTHHGPSRVGAPCVFVELGSGPSEWEDSDGAAAVARAVVDLPPHEPVAERTVVGIGGGHYAPRFTRVLRETDWRIGHVAADWALQELSSERRREIIDHLFAQSGTTVALIDAEGAEIASMVEHAGYEVVSETWLREADGVSLDLVNEVERRLGPIDGGARLGARTDVDPADLVTYSIPSEIRRLVEATDREAAVRTIAATTTAYKTVERGNRLGDQVLVPDGTALSDIVEKFIPMLEEAYAAVSLTEDMLEVTERTFDPQAAADLGVPEGPAFGKLANEQAVEVGDRTIWPEAVHTTNTKHISLE